MVIRLHYGSIVGFLHAHGYGGPKGNNLTEAYAERSGAMNGRMARRG